MDIIQSGYKNLFWKLSLLKRHCKAWKFHFYPTKNVPVSRNHDCVLIMLIKIFVKALAVSGAHKKWMDEILLAFGLILTNFIQNKNFSFILRLFCFLDFADRLICSWDKRYVFRPWYHVVDFKELIPSAWPVESTALTHFGKSLILVWPRPSGSQTLGTITGTKRIPPVNKTYHTQRTVSNNKT